MMQHFVTGAFGQTIELSGQGTNRKWFHSEITVESLRDKPQAEIMLVPELPEDNAAKIQQAVALSQPMADGMPLMSRYDILETVLERQDPDADYDRVMDMMSTQNQLVMAHRMVDALVKTGDIESAQYWQMQWQMMLQKLAEVGLDPNQVIKPGEENGQGPFSGNGFTPEVLSNAGQGIPPPTPGVDTPFQGGPNVEPGRERPGAQI